MDKNVSVILLLSLCWATHSTLANFPPVRMTISGKPCLNTCKNGRCAVDYKLNTELCCREYHCSSEELGIDDIFFIGRSKRHCRGLDKIFSQEYIDSSGGRVRDGSKGHTEDLIDDINRSGMNVEYLTNPSAPFTFVATTNATNTKGATVYLPLIVQATLRQIATPVRRQSSDIPGAARRNVNNMYNGMVQGIDVGHIVAFQNGGTRDLFNFVGQTLELNRGPYRTIENIINDWINFEGTAELTLVVVYRRTVPHEFAVKLKLFNADGSLHSDLQDVILKNI